MISRWRLSILFLFALLPACAAVPPAGPSVALSTVSQTSFIAPTETGISPTTAPPVAPSATPEPTVAPTPSLTPEPSPVPTPTGTPLPVALGLDPADWKNWRVIPVVPERARQIYQLGQSLGNDPHAFSIFGDCQSEPDVFMGVYETDPELVASLPPDLQETAAWFTGSFNRPSPTVRGGTTTGALLWAIWHQNKFTCTVYESPVTCELRIHKPSFVIIHVGTHYENRNADYMRKILDQLIAAGVVPILASKADNRELDDRVNIAYAQLAAEYNIPFWNFWAAVDALPNRGLYTRPDATYQGDLYLTDEAAAIHRMTALQVLDVVRRAVTGVTMTYGKIAPMNFSRITDNLFIGDTPSVADYDQLRDLCVRLVINMRLEKRPAADPHHLPLKLLWLPTVDNPLFPIPIYFLMRGVRAALETIKTGGKVYTHCAKGRHRGVAMGASILIAQGYDPEQAMELIKAQRPIADPDIFYIRSCILQFAKKISAVR